jgi:hypothetical protein
MNIHFEKHRGVQFMDSGMCIFYGIPFEGILEVARFLRTVSHEGNYEGEVYCGIKMLRDVDTDMYYTGERWWPSKKLAKKYAKRLKVAEQSY